MPVHSLRATPTMTRSLSHALRIGARTTVPPPLNPAARVAKRSSSHVPRKPEKPAAAGREPGLGTHCEIRGQNRADRYALQTVGRKALGGIASPKGTRYRLLNCQRATRNTSLGVDILAGPKGARFGGLQTCGSVWACSVCAAKITRHRETEIQKAMDEHRAAGGHCIMVSLTHSHKKRDELAQLVAGYGKATSSMKSWRGFKKLREDLGYLGEIRALEVTWGERNGFHPHGHELWFIGKKPTQAQLDKLEADIFTEWAKACEKHGLPAPSAKHGIKVSVAWSAAEYMAKFGRDQKWGAGKELTRNHSKKGGSAERFTPFDFLRAIEVGHQPGLMTGLFREYVKAYHGRRQCRWSDGLKKHFKIDEIEDAAAAEKVEAEHKLAGRISIDDWRNRVLAQPRDRRVELLEAFEQGGMQDVATLLATMPIGRCPEDIPDPTKRRKTTPIGMRQWS